MLECGRYHDMLELAASAPAGALAAASLANQSALPPLPYPHPLTGSGSRGLGLSTQEAAGMPIHVLVGTPASVMAAAPAVGVAAAGGGGGVAAKAEVSGMEALAVVEDASWRWCGVLLGHGDVPAALKALDRALVSCPPRRMPYSLCLRLACAWQLWCGGGARAGG